MSVPLLLKFWKPAVLAAALAFVYWTMLGRLGHDWWTDQNYSHGLLIPLIIGYLLWTERERLGKAIPRPSIWWGGAAIAFAVLFLWAGTAGAELYLQRMSLVLMLAGIVVYFWGFSLLKLLLVPLGLLVLAIPIPAIIFNKIAFPLQLFASRGAVWVMRLFDIPVLRQGNIIELKPLNSIETKKLEVVEACSGIRSLMTLVTLAVIYAYFTHPRPNDKGDGGKPQDGRLRGGIFNALRHYPFWRATILVLAAVPIAILTNALRVSGTGLLAHYYGTEVADGFFHSFSGWVVYIAAFFLLIAVGWILDLLGGRGNNDQGTKPGGVVAPKATAEKEDVPAKAGSQPAPVGVMTAKGIE